VLLAALIFLLTATIFSFAQISVTAPDKLIVDDAPDQEVVSYGRTVIVRMRAKGVLAIGGDVIVEGQVSGDVGSIGGSVIQREGGYIGGDVFVIGGQYRPEGVSPLREAGRETVMYAGYEDELRDLTQNPSSLLAPSFSLAFLAQRLLSVLFWFVISLVMVTIAPGAVSRAVARFQLSTLRVVALGVAAFLVSTIGVIASLRVLPNYLGAIVGFMAFVLLMLAYVFGRVALTVALGKLVQKYLSGQASNSEALAILFGVLIWTIVLSIPYVWTIALFVLFSAGVGLVLTARSQRTWQSP
jgi:hypothetical protein